MITVEQALEAIDNLDDYARMDAGVDAVGPRELLVSFVSQYEQLRAELAAANLYRPCQRKDMPHVPVKAIGPTNFAFYGIVETNEEFAERAGTQVKEVEE